VERSLLHRSNNYLIYLKPQPKLNQMLNEAGILSDSLVLNYGIAKRLVRQSCCAASYLRGAFLGRGFVSDPRRGDYHFEITTDARQLARDLRDLMNHFQLGARLSEREKDYQVYLKDSDQIVRFLTLAGAFSSLLAWEDIRILKELRNQVNRLVNCDTANLSKTVEAAITQLENISIIDEEMGLSNLSKGLREVVFARRSFPQASIQELGESCQPTLSKSAVYHRLRRLNRLAESLKNDYGEVSLNVDLKKGQGSRVK
jgi:DNA-binding protein WhiA